MKLLRGNLYIVEIGKKRKMEDRSDFIYLIVNNNHQIGQHTIIIYPNSFLWFFADVFQATKRRLQ